MKTVHSHRPLPKEREVLATERISCARPEEENAMTKMHNDVESVTFVTVRLFI